MSRPRIQQFFANLSKLLNGALNQPESSVIKAIPPDPLCSRPIPYVSHTKCPPTMALTLRAHYVRPVLIQSKRSNPLTPTNFIYNILKLFSAHNFAEVDSRHPWHSPCGRTACVPFWSSQNGQILSRWPTPSTHFHALFCAYQGPQNTANPAFSHTIKPSLFYCLSCH